MIQQIINGICMALADSVPGVSGGTIAFIMGFYDKFIGSINNIVFGKKEERIEGIKFMLKLGIGWVGGMIAAVLVLSSLFESQIYVISSLFLGFIIGAIPLIAMEEKKILSLKISNIICLLAGIGVVAAITYFNSSKGSSSMDLSTFSIGTAIKMFFIGMAAISAMFLPGISGSTLLLVFGAYIPVITAVKELLHLNISYAPLMLFFACGIVVGAVSVVKIIKICLDKYRSQTVFVIFGMMLGSLYAITMGPTTLKTPKAALDLKTFSIIAFIIGFAIVIGLQKVKEMRESKN